MNHVINQGKAFYWGTSEWNQHRIMEAYQIAKKENLVPPLMEQPQYNMLHREKVEKEFLPLYKKYFGSQVLPSGAHWEAVCLPGKYKIMVFLIKAD